MGSQPTLLYRHHDLATHARGVKISKVHVAYTNVTSQSCKCTTHFKKYFGQGSQPVCSRSAQTPGKDKINISVPASHKECGSLNQVGSTHSYRLVSATVTLYLEGTKPPASFPSENGFSFHLFIPVEHSNTEPRVLREAAKQFLVTTPIDRPTFLAFYFTKG